jgi:5-methylcytosine-specific restriction endonuclease McrA
MNYEQFKEKYLIEGYTDRKGNPKHTRFIKHLIYKFNNRLKEEFGFDIFICQHCNINEWNGRPIIMELDHINRITNDSRITNLRPLCPNCHQQTLGYKNRKVEIEEYVKVLESKVNL